MKIIDAHLHLFPAEEPRFEAMAQQVGHHNSVDHLRRVYGELNIVHGVDYSKNILCQRRYSWFPVD